jgi:hypothetical protein
MFFLRCLFYVNTLINLFPPLREKKLPLFQKNAPLSPFFSPLPHKKRSAD